MKQVLVFSTPVCPACAALKPIIERLVEEHGFSYRAHVLNTTNRDLFVAYNIRTAPTVVLLEDGAPTKSLPGFYGEKVLVEKLREWGVIE